MGRSLSGAQFRAADATERAALPLDAGYSGATCWQEDTSETYVWDGSAWVFLGGEPEAWHYIGDPGEPAFQNSWDNLSAIAGAGYDLGSYRKYDGRVYLGGYYYGGTMGTTIFTLPVGYRPSKKTTIPCFIGDFAPNQAFGVLTIQTTGAIAATSPSAWVPTGVNTVAASGWVVAAALSGIGFWLEPPDLST